MKYAFLNFIRDKMTMFWMFLFPIFLMLILLSALPSDDYKIEIKAYISPENPLAEYMDFSDDFKFTISDDYEKLLKDDKIDGYVDKDNNVIIAKNGFKQMALKSIIDNDIRVNKDPEAASEVIKGDFIKLKTDNIGSRSSLFFAILAMLSYMCAYSGVASIEKVQANITDSAMRFLISPKSKLKAILDEFIVAMLMQVLNLTISLLFVKYVLKENFVSDYPMTYLIFIAGSIFSYSLGLLTVYLGNISSNARGAIVQSSMMILSGGAGLYGIFLRIILTNVFGKAADFNPLKLITDSVYKVNMIGSTDGIGLKTGVLIGVAILFTLLASLKIRENRYESI
jgi:hypothetical protein